MTDNFQYTFSLIKPSGIPQKIVGKILQYFENGGLTIVATKLINLSEKQAQIFYKQHIGRPFFQDLIEHITSGAVIALVLYGKNAINKSREIIGATDPKQANPGTIRGDLAESIDANLVHGSDSTNAAEREIHLFFSDMEIIQMEEIN